MVLGIFRDWGAVVACTFAGISAAGNVINMIRGTPSKHRRRVLAWGWGIFVLFAMLAIDASVDALPPWSQWVMVGVALIAAWLVGRSTVTPSEASAPAQTEPTLNTLSVKPHFTDSEGIDHKKKLTIILQNAGKREIIVGPGTKWITGDLMVRHIPELVWELEPADGWHSDKWKWQSAEKRELRVPPGRAFRTWISLHDNASESEVDRLRDQRGTLTFPLREIGAEVERKIRV